MIKIGVLRGGPNNDFEISLRTGQSVLNSLEGSYDTKDILVDRNGEWFIDGIPVLPERVINRFDLIFNCLHGSYGEDGKVQQLLDSFFVPYTGSGVMGSAIAINRHLAKRNYLINGFNVPRHEVIPVSLDLKNKLRGIYNKWSLPLVVKPLNATNISGVTVVSNYFDLKEALSNAFEYSNEVIIEEFIRGKRASCCVAENFRDKELYTFLPTENIVIGGEEQEFIPGRFSSEEKEVIQALAERAHKTLGLRHYSKSDFIIGSKKVYILGTSSLPNLDEESTFSKSLESVGSSLEEFTKHIVNLALS
jgi:D-alanine-D-alanine ligase